MNVENHRIAELEAELALLKRTTLEALAKSWAEVERFQKEAEEYQQIQTASMHLRDTRSSSCSRKRFSLNIDQDNIQYDKNKQSTSEILLDAMSVITDDTASSSIADDGSENWSASSAISSSFRNMGVGSPWGSARRQIAIQTKIEKDLMRQLEFMQDDKLATEQELKLKLRQREDAIGTLEATVVIQNQTIQNLRVEMDEIRKTYEESNRSHSHLEGSKQYLTLSIRQMESTLRKDSLESTLQLTQTKRRLQPGSTERNRRNLQDKSDCEQRRMRGKSCDGSHQDCRSGTESFIGERNRLGKSHESPARGRKETSNGFAEQRRRGRSCESPDHRRDSAENRCRGKSSERSSFLIDLERLCLPQPTLTRAISATNPTLYSNPKSVSNRTTSSRLHSVHNVDGINNLSRPLLLSTQHHS